MKEPKGCIVASMIDDYIERESEPWEFVWITLFPTKWKAVIAVEQLRWAEYEEIEDLDIDPPELLRIDPVNRYNQ